VFLLCCFFFQAEDGIRDRNVTGVQTCALPIFEAAGMGFENIVKTTIFISNMGDFPKINDVYGAYFPGKLPARSCVEVSRLPKDVQVEIEVVASKMEP